MCDIEYVTRKPILTGGNVFISYMYILMSYLTNTPVVFNMSNTTLDYSNYSAILS